MYCLFFVPTIDKSYQGSFEGEVVYSSLQVIKWLKYQCKLQMDNTQTKRLKVFYSDMLIISPRMFKEGWGGGGGWGRCNSDLSLKCVSWEFPVMQIVLFFLDTWAIFLCDHLHHPNHYCFLDN